MVIAALEWDARATRWVSLIMLSLHFFQRQFMISRAARPGLEICHLKLLSINLPPVFFSKRFQKRFYYASVQAAR